MPLVPEEDVRFQRGTLLRVTEDHHLRVHPTGEQTTWYDLRPGDVCVVLYTRLGKKKKGTQRHHWTVMLTKFGLTECGDQVIGGFYRNVEIVR